MASSREEIRNASRVLTQEVPIPSMGLTLRIRQMSPAQLDEFRSQGNGGGGHIAEWLLANCIVDDDGKPVWTVDEVRQEVYFQTRELYAIAVMEVNGLSEKKIEAAEKNSQPDQS